MDANKSLSPCFAKAMWSINMGGGHFNAYNDQGPSLLFPILGGCVIFEPTCA